MKKAARKLLELKFRGELTAFRTMDIKSERCTLALDAMFAIESIAMENASHKLFEKPARIDASEFTKYHPKVAAIMAVLSEQLREME